MILNHIGGAYIFGPGTAGGGNGGNELINNGMDEETPCALVQQGL